MNVLFVALINFQAYCNKYEDSPTKPEKYLKKCFKDEFLFHWLLGVIVMSGERFPL
jgi:hypothetical protein